MFVSTGITFFTVVMNRLHHLSITLPVNLVRNTGDRTDFLILDYGSTDGVESYLAKNFHEELVSGRVKYFRVDHAGSFDRCHSRNIAARLATGEIICNVDADNFIAPGFDYYLQSRFNRDEKLFLTGIGNRSSKIDASGKMALLKSDFMEVGGYDESFNGYGYEEYDLAGRLKTYGLTESVLEDEEHLESVSHCHQERISNEWVSQHLQYLYTQQVNASTKVMLFLYRDSTLQYGIVIHNDVTSCRLNYHYSLAGRCWQQGAWKQAGDIFRLQFADFDCEIDRLVLNNADMLVGNNHFLLLQQDPVVIEEAIIFNTEIANRYRRDANRVQQVVRVNRKGYGMAEVMQRINEKTYRHILLGKEVEYF